MKYINWPIAGNLPLALPIPGTPKQGVIGNIYSNSRKKQNKCLKILRLNICDIKLINGKNSNSYYPLARSTPKGRLILI